jgi:hypothetical protein
MSELNDFVIDADNSESIQKLFGILYGMFEKSQ